VSFEDAFFRRHDADIAALERAEQYTAQRGILTEHADDLLRDLLEEHGRAGRVVVLGDTALLALCDALDAPRRLCDETLSGSQGFWVLVVPGVAYEAIEAYMELRRPFAPLQHFLAGPGAAATLDPTGPAGIPPDAPPEIAQQLWNAIAQQVLKRSAGAGVKVPFRLVNALIESCRTASENVTHGYITAMRLGDGQIRCVTTGIGAAWETVAVAAPAVPA
jgi:hypothetical protein